VKAIVCSAYGTPEVLRIQEFEKPVPKDDDVLIKVCATSVNRGDSSMRGLEIPGLGWQLILIPRRLRKRMLAYYWKS